jgi:hypothetical protein
LVYCYNITMTPYMSVCAGHAPHMYVPEELCVPFNSAPCLAGTAPGAEREANRQCLHGKRFQQTVLNRQVFAGSCYAIAKSATTSRYGFLSWQWRIQHSDRRDAALASSKLIDQMQPWLHQRAYAHARHLETIPPLPCRTRYFLTHCSGNSRRRGLTCAREL